jgi:hypothetical protein
MAVISVPGGSYSTTFSAENVSISTLDNATFQNALVSLFNTGFNTGFNNNPSLFVTNDPSAPLATLNPGSGQNLLVLPSTFTPTGTIVMQAGFNALANEITSGNVTVVGNAGSPSQTGESILSAGGNFTFYSQAGESGTLISAAGNMLFTAPSVNGGNWTIDLTGTTGANTIVAGSSNSEIVDGGGETNTIFLGSGADTVGVYGTDTLVGGSGQDTVFFNGTGSVLYGNTGTLMVVDNGGSNTVYGGTGADTFFAAANGGTYVGGGSTNIFVAQASTTGSTYTATTGNSTIFALDGSTGTYNIGQGNFVFVGTSGSSSTIDGAYGDSTAVVFGNAGSNVMFNGNAIGNILVASGANTTLNASGSAGGDIFFNRVAAGQSATLMGGSYYNFFLSGPGNATMQGGAGHNFFFFFAGEDGGSNLITNWNANDQIGLFGYSSSQVNEATVNGSTVITLSDGTTVTVQNQTLSNIQNHIKIV